jgi:hypothetical protein
MKNQFASFKRLLLVVSAAWAIAISAASGQTTNDLFIDRALLTGTNITVQSSNLNATLDTGEPEQKDFAAGASVWWTWTAPTTGTLRVDTIGSDFDSTLAIYSGDSLKNLTELGVDDDGSGEGITSQVILAVQAGTTYQIAVAGYDSDAGNIVLHLDLGLAAALAVALEDVNALTGSSVEFAIGIISAFPLDYQWQRSGTNLVETNGISGTHSAKLKLIGLTVGDAAEYTVIASNSFGSITNSARLAVFEPALNDAFADRIVLFGTNITTSGHNVGATLELEEPGIEDEQNAYSVWWTWTSTADAPIKVFTPQNTLFDAITVYTGDMPGNMTQQGHGHNSVMFDAKAGTVYQIQVTSAAGTGGGPFTLKLMQILTPIFVSKSPTFPLPAGASADWTASFRSASPIHYQWQHGGTNLLDDARIQGVNSTNLHIANVSLSDAGDYLLIANNEYGSATNSTFLLVGLLERITNSTTLTNITFASSSPLHYFVISVPPGQSRLSIKSNEKSQVAVTYATYFGPATQFYTSDLPGSAAVLISNPAAGDWYIAFFSADPLAGTTLSVEYSPIHPSLDVFQIQGSVGIVQLSGLDGWNSTVLESSADLIKWLPIQTNQVTGNMLSVTNLLNRSSPPSFLRAVFRGNEPRSF